MLARLLLLATPLLLVVAGCSVVDSLRDDDVPTSDDPLLSFSFERVGGSGFIDQTIDIVSDASQAQAPTLQYVALDSDGAELVGTSVVTAYGSDRGLLVVPAEGAALDILRFEGPGARDVRDVRVSVASTTALADTDLPSDLALEVVKLDAAGRRMDAGLTAEVEVRNPTDEPLSVRIVGIEYEDPPPGASQQFVRITPLFGTVEIAPGDTYEADLARDQRSRFFGSIKAYATPPEP